MNIKTNKSGKRKKQYIVDAEEKGVKGFCLSLWQ